MNNDAVKDIQELCLQLSPETLKQPGGVLYSSKETLSPGTLLILGLNPGGDGGSVTIRQSAEALSSRTENDYLSSWREDGRNAGGAPLQRRIKEITETLGLNIEDVCAGNIIFRQTPDAKSLSFPKEADTYWPIIEKIIRTVSPKMIICFGNSHISPYAYLSSKLPVEKVFDEIKAGHGEWKVRFFGSEKGLIVIGLPHLSRYKPKPHILNKIKELYQAH